MGQRISKTLTFSDGFRVAIKNARAEAAEMTISPGQQEGDSGNRHKGADQWLYVVNGTGRARVGKRWITLGAGTLLLIEAGRPHEVRNTGRRPLRTLNF
jgi:mannose-6-phosphate isomerase-like protein (cupin superfamily)